MEPIQSSLKKYMQESGWEEALQRVRQDVLTEKRVHDWLFANGEALSAGAVEQGMTALLEYKNSWQNCDQCPGLDKCPNPMTGHQPELYPEHGQIHMRYHPCPLQKAATRRRKQEALVKSLYVSAEFKKATLENVDIDDTDDRRSTALKKAIAFAHEVVPGEEGQGLYLHGMFGVGKTYMMAAIANALADRQIQSMLVYAPEFFREMRQAIGEGSVDEKIDAVKRVPVLMLDDIGAETMSNWIRDDVLGAILQHRMTEKLPTVYTSNWDYEELEAHFSYSNKGGEERMKAKRIMERIRPFTTELYLSGRNRRET
ncbi:primosomal protein DnaI [Natribacillus halophilus]|uniref:Replicative DNA helicase loader DnaI n=1 Tax=Natribacillus halophilus TaxID=549003 RepID=A0A1G8RYG7_9BACI|nr:primosomal protein DnaI [Natribacillus halophilus]SDJ22018.1 replicative DNA helicase loader DnaI [Natribacillus halophilus]